jgi:hypothetical protein
LPFAHGLPGAGGEVDFLLHRPAGGAQWASMRSRACCSGFWFSVMRELAAA